MEGIEYGDLHYIVFEPTQIKSAIGNNGEYDPNNPDIVMEQGGSVWSSNDGYSILVNDKENANHITLFKNGEKIGALNASVSEIRGRGDDGKYTDDWEKWLKISYVEIDKPHRGQGLGKRLYDALQKHSSKDIKGIISYLPDRSNKSQIPRIYDRYKNRVIDDYHYIYFSDGGSVEVEDLHLWGKTERELFLRYDEIKKADTISDYEASLLVAIDNELFNDIEEYKNQNTPIPKDSEKKLLKILDKVKPVDKVFYRGVDEERYDDYHIMKVQSWTPSKDIAEMFGSYVYKTTTPSKGVEVSDIYYLNGLINNDSDGLGDSQEEWLLLNPKKEIDSTNPDIIMREGGSITDNSNFKKWFGDSKAVDEKGEPLIVYHQTQEKFNEFDIQKSYTHSFWFTSNLDNILRGETGATQRPDAEVVVMEVYLSIQNMAGWDEYDKYGVGELISMGYDGIKLDDDYVVFEPTQIKSATDNNGDYNPNNPKITMSQGGQTPAQQEKISKVMGEFKRGELNTSYGTKVTDDKQAIAIALSESGVEKKQDGGALRSQQLEIGSSPELTLDMFPNSPMELATGGMFSERATSKWEDVPVAWRNIRPIKKVSYQLMPDNKGLETILKPFVSDDSLRPPMAGIYFSGTHISATNAHVLVSIPHKVAKSEVGIYPTAKTIKDSKKDTYLAEAIVDGKIEGKFPNYENVIPTAEVIEESYEIDVYKLYQYTQAALNYSNKTTHQVAYKVSEKSEISFNGRLLISMLKPALQMGHDKLYFHFSSSSKAGLFTTDKDYTFSSSLIFLIMPVIYQISHENYGSRDLDFNLSLSVYFDFSKNSIVNEDGSIAEFKMNYGEVEMFTKPLLRLIKSSIWKSSVLPILDNVKILDKTLTITDLESTVEINNIDLPNGLYEQDNNSFMQSEQDIEDYPKAARLGEDIVADLTMDADYLKWAIDTTSDFTGNDDLRPVMMGVSIKRDSYGSIIFAATDAHRLVRIDAGDHISSNLSEGFAIIVPHKALKQFLQFSDTGNITLKSDGTITVIESDLGRLTTRNYDGKYPNYDGVIPREFVSKHTTDLDAFKKCVTSKESTELYKKINNDGDTPMLSATYSDGKINMSVIETKQGDTNGSRHSLCSISGSHEDGAFTTPATMILLMPMMNDDDTPFFNANPTLTKRALKNLSGETINIYSIEKSKGLGFFGSEFEYKKSPKKAVAKKKSPSTTKAKGESIDSSEINKLIRGLKVLAKSTKLANEKKEYEQLARGLKAML
jgi:DNA polymerase III sliding clamp (beta) subunit (PCNA family)/ribosomal protein S18 acetylase RimI-like enzyme